MTTPAVHERLQSLGATIVAPTTAARNISASSPPSEIKKWEAPIKASGVQVE